MQQNPELLLKPLVDIATRAGEAILEIYNTAFSVELKDDSSPLTAADKASHRTIVSALEELTPDIPVLSEESAVVDWVKRSAWQEYWLIDPLDGTKEFIKRNGEFTVNIALIQGHQAVLGVVYAPVLRRCFFGSRNGGAFEQTAAGDARRIKVAQHGTFPFAGGWEQIASRRTAGLLPGQTGRACNGADGQLSEACASLQPAKRISTPG